MVLSKAETKQLAALDRAIRHAVADRDLCRSYANHAGAARCTQVVDELLDRRHASTRAAGARAAQRRVPAAYTIRTWRGPDVTTRTYTARTWAAANPPMPTAP